MGNQTAAEGDKYLVHEHEYLVEQLRYDWLQCTNVILIILVHKVPQRHGGIHFDLGTATFKAVSRMLLHHCGAHAWNQACSLEHVGIRK